MATSHQNIQIHSIYTGRPQTHTDEEGSWRSSIFRQLVNGPIEVEMRGLAGDRSADTRVHGTPDQAICCHSLAHHEHWRTIYPDAGFGPGAVGENWTLLNGDESSVCIGDIYTVGSARVQATAPRVPCFKQERKLKIPGFIQATLETLRTGFYLRVLTPGIVNAGDEWLLEERPHPGLTMHSLNVIVHQAFDPALASQFLDAGILPFSWRRRLSNRLR